MARHGKDDPFMDSDMGGFIIVMLIVGLPLLMGLAAMEGGIRADRRAAHERCTILVADSLQRGALQFTTADKLFDACMRAVEPKP